MKAVAATMNLPDLDDWNCPDLRPARTEPRPKDRIFVDTSAMLVHDNTLPPQHPVELPFDHIADPPVALNQ
jgi:hypothetical protein